jgi:polyisoprenoid-binding protein YceI
MYRLLVLLLLVSIIHTSYSQSEYRIAGQNSKMTVKGTSSLHDWQCRVEQVTGQAKAEVEGGKLTKLSSLTLSATSNSIRSIKENGDYYEKAMDKNIYKALATDKHPNIVFTLSKVNSMKASGTSTLIDASGVLSIAGTRKEAIITVKATPGATGIVFEGSVPIKMTDFNVDPPTALFGTIKTGNDVVVDFKMTFLAVK